MAETKLLVVEVGENPEIEAYHPEHCENQHPQNEDAKVERQEDHTEIPNAHLSKKSK